MDKKITLNDVTTDECIKNAIFCLQNPHDCLESEVDEAREMALYALKAREPKMVAGVAETYKDIWVGNCPSCGQSIVTNVNKQTQYCSFCGQRVAFFADAIAMLKAREPVEPTLRGGIGGYWYCGACNYQISRGDKFCRYCGQKVKWK